MNYTRRLNDGEGLRVDVRELDKITSFDEYQLQTSRTAIYPTDRSIEYLALGLASEAGEVAGVVKKWLRDDTPEAEFDEKILKEMGDTMWYLSQLHNELDYLMSVTAAENINKLRARQENHTLGGSGDNR